MNKIYNLYIMKKRSLETEPAIPKKIKRKRKMRRKFLDNFIKYKLY